MSLTPEQKATNCDTQEHIHVVQKYMNVLIVDLLRRAHLHDRSKLAPPEVEYFTEYTPKLASSKYPSPEYDEFRKLMKPGLDHHYANNRHHPEHFPEIETVEIQRLENDILDLKSLLSIVDIKPSIGEVIDPDLLRRLITILENHILVLKSPVNNMNLQDLVEMFCDWKAASERQHGGNIRKSIDSNATRFGISEQLVNIMSNTVESLDT